MKKQREVKGATANWKALESASECFRQIWVRQKLRSPLSNCRSKRGMPNAGSSQIDFLADYIIAVRTTYTPAQRTFFWQWLWSPVTTNGYKPGTERWAQRLGGAIVSRGLIPSEYFRGVIRTGKDDHSPLIGDFPRMTAIQAKYDYLRAKYPKKLANESESSESSDKHTEQYAERYTP